MELERKERHAQEKLQMFEQRRKQEAAETQRQAELKAEKMSEVARQNELLEMQRKQEL